MKKSLLFQIADLGWADVGYNGTRYYETPNIDKLHHAGITFSNAYAGGATPANGM